MAVPGALVLNQILEALHSLTQGQSSILINLITSCGVPRLVCRNSGPVLLNLRTSCGIPRASLTTQLSALHSTQTTLASQHSHLFESLVSMSSRMFQIEARSTAAFSNPKDQDLVLDPRPGPALATGPHLVSWRVKWRLWSSLHLLMIPFIQRLDCAAVRGC